MLLRWPYLVLNEIYLISYFQTLEIIMINCIDLILKILVSPIQWVWAAVWRKYMYVCMYVHYSLVRFNEYGLQCEGSICMYVCTLLVSPIQWVYGLQCEGSICMYVCTLTASFTWVNGAYFSFKLILSDIDEQCVSAPLWSEHLTRHILYFKVSLLFITQLYIIVSLFCFRTGPGKIC